MDNIQNENIDNINKPKRQYNKKSKEQNKTIDYSKLPICIFPRKRLEEILIRCNAWGNNISWKIWEENGFILTNFENKLQLVKND